MSKNINVTIQKSNKLTLTEINALVSIEVAKIESANQLYNKNLKESTEYKNGLKALKKKHKITQAEKEIEALRLKYPHVEISIRNQSYYTDLSSMEYRLRKSHYVSDEKKKELKNRLVLAQVNNTNMTTLVSELAKEILN